jgi:hypothetical protein
MSDFHSVSWREGEARVKSFSGASKGGKSTIRIEIEVTDAERFGHIMWELGEASKPPKPKPKALPKAQLALPSPGPRLFDGRDK